MSFSVSQSISQKKERRGRPQLERRTEAAYHPQVAAKLRGHPSFKDCSEQQIDELVNRITKPEELVGYFDLTQDKEQDSAATLLAGEHEVEALEVQLVLKHLTCKAQKPRSIETMLLQEYGPLQAYLVIGEVVLEWDWKSLVIPHGKPLRDSATSSIVRVDVREAELPSVPVELLKTKVLDLVAQYNRMYYYLAIRRSAHDFVCSILQAMNYSPLPPQLQNTLKDYLKDLEKGKNQCVPEQFDTHEVLDFYVEQHGRKLNEIDIEYVIVHYFMLHMAERMKHCDDPWSWTCTEPNCKMKILEAMVDHKNILLNKYKTVKYHFHESSIF